MGLLQSLPLVGKLFRTSEPRSEQVAAFWAHMQAHYGTCLVNKLSSTEMELVGQALDALGILDRARFLGGFATTIGKRIYVPFEPGVPFGCRAADVAVAQKALALAAVSVRSGAVLNDASKVALDWLNEHASDFAFLRNT